MSDTPIEDYALLSDRHSAALVARSGTVDWLCFPRFDSPSVFGALLDDAAGHWSIRPVGPASAERRYLDEAMVLRTEYTTVSGTLVVTDALATGPCDDPHRLGTEAPHLLIRSMECTAGEVRVELVYRPRPEYGLAFPQLLSCDGGVRAEGGSSVLALSSPVALDVAVDEVTGTVDLRAGQHLRLALRWAPLGAPAPRFHSQPEIAEFLDDTVAAWRKWSQVHQRYTGPWRDLVAHSGRVLQALSFQPTGAIIAAATTSLPEERGGERNWDYRYAWVRDAAFTMDALWVAACPDEANEFFSFMTAAAATGRPRSHLQIMYGIGGEHDLTERELAHMSGWSGSRPVRVGNRAWNQSQLDVYGELLATAARFADQLGDAGPGLRAFLVRLADTAAQVWRSPDHGIWEIRGEPRHFLYSKLMCWVALERAVALADQLDAADRVSAWTEARQEIEAAILDQGWNTRVGAFTQSFGGDALDASALTLPIVGFLPGDDARVLSTVDAVRERLTDVRGLVRRYDPGTGVDGLSGEEGSFLLCTFWLAQAQALAGRMTEARATFEHAVSHANDLGLLSEQIDPRTGRMLGNFPQAFSHIGLVNAAWTIEQAERSVRGRPEADV